MGDKLLYLESEGINKDIAPLFDPIEWELKIKNIEEVSSKTSDIAFNIISNPNMREFLTSLSANRTEKFLMKLNKTELSDEEKGQKFQEYTKDFNRALEEEITLLHKAFTNGISKLEQKQKANGFITDVIDRDENIKLACMNSLYEIYKSYLNPSLLKHLINIMGNGDYKNGVIYITTKKYKNERKNVHG